MKKLFLIFPIMLILETVCTSDVYLKNLDWLKLKKKKPIL